METVVVIIALITLILFIVVLVKFLGICKDISVIRSIFEDKWGDAPVPEPIIEHRGKGSADPTKADVREFQDRIKEHKKTLKDIDQQWLESLIAEYNERFNEDFHQYL